MPTSRPLRFNWPDFVISEKCPKGAFLITDKYDWSIRPERAKMDYRRDTMSGNLTLGGPYMNTPPPPPGIFRELTHRVWKVVEFGARITDQGDTRHRVTLEAVVFGENEHKPQHTFDISDDEYGVMELGDFIHINLTLEQGL